MKKIGSILILAVLLGVGVYYVTAANTWATTETLAGYDSEAAATATPVESFRNLNESTSQLDSTSMAGALSNTPANAITNIFSGGFNPPHGQPGHRCDLPDGAALGPSQGNSLPSTASSNTLNSGGANPPHGEPGHQCGIAVGAPLPALNPAHGQPGHQCGIPVGSPLDGTTINSSSSPSINTDNTNSSLNPLDGSIASGLNPAHGQPGHQCGIPVGSPLPTS